MKRRDDGLLEGIDDDLAGPPLILVISVLLLEAAALLVAICSRFPAGAS